MSAIQLENRKYSKKEYDELTKSLDYKIEYHAGHIRAMAGGRPEHNKLAGNIYGMLYNALFEKDCIVYNSDQAIHVAQHDKYLYPDASVVCGKEDFERDLYLNNPTLIIEVLSPSTGNYDKGEKWLFYQSIPSLKEYLILYPNKPVVMNYSKNSNGDWIVTGTMGLKSMVRINHWGLDLAMGMLYRNMGGLEEVV